MIPMMMQSSVGSFDAAIADAVRTCGEGLDDLRETLIAAKPALELGSSLGKLKDISDDTYETLYGVVDYLCGEQRYEEALPVALQLMAHDPRDYRFPLAAAHCLHSQGDRRLAIPLYGASLLAKATPLASVLLGECFAELGEAPAALRCFEGVERLCIADGSQDSLRERAAESVRLLEASAISFSLGGLKP
jgi:tetratricopeptide (TPR) repeat protein